MSPLLVRRWRRKDGRWSKRYYCRKQIGGTIYLRALGLRQGQQHLVSERLRQVEDEITAEHYNLRPPGGRGRHSLLLSELVSLYEEQKAGSKKTLDRDRQKIDVLKSIAGDRALPEFTPELFKRLERQLFEERGIKPATVNRYMEVYRGLFGVAVPKYLAQNPLADYEPWLEDGERRALSPGELRAVFAAAREISAAPHSSTERELYNIMRLGILTGLRLHEILTLKWSYIEGDLARIPITAMKSRRRHRGSSSRPRIQPIPLSRLALEILRSYERRKEPLPAGPGPEDEYVLPLTRRDSQSMFRPTQKIRALSKVADFIFHQLRHATSTKIAGRFDLITSQAYLGHRDIKTTQRYTHPQDELVRQAADYVDEFVSDVLAGPEEASH